MTLARAVVAAATAAALARVAGAALVSSLGFRVVSDDDFARVVIAQRFAASPSLDPTGTSWLPMPFWIVGAAMRALGSTLTVARVLAVVLAALSGALVAGIAVAAGVRAKRAIAAATLAAFMPWAMQLAVATVPEVPAAACAAAGAIALAARAPNVRVVGGVALLASTLSRYDAWPIAVAFAVVTLRDAARASPNERRGYVVAASIAALGPAAWSLWQWAVYGDALRYLRLVRSYRKALGAGPSLVERLVGYPYGVVEEMREALAAGLLGAVCALIVERRCARGDLRGTLGVDWRRPLLLALLQLCVLIAGDVRDGAPTHHPERALLGPATIVLFASGDAVGAVVASMRARATKLLFGAACFLALAAYIGLRLHRSLGWYDAAPRPREVAAGAALAEHAQGARVLLDTRDLPGGAIDYGYYAVLAAFGRPLDAEIDRDQDPRRPRGASAFLSADTLRERLLRSRATTALVWGEERARVAESIGGRIVAMEAIDRAEPRWRIVAFSPSAAAQ